MKSMALATDGGSQTGKQRAPRAGQSQKEFSAHPSPSHARSFWPVAHVWPSLCPTSNPGSGNQGLLGNTLGKKKGFYVLLREGSYVILGQSL